MSDETKDVAEAIRAATETWETKHGTPLTAHERELLNFAFSLGVEFAKTLGGAP